MRAGDKAYIIRNNLVTIATVGYIHRQANRKFYEIEFCGAINAIYISRKIGSSYVSHPIENGHTKSVYIVRHLLSYLFAYTHEYLKNKINNLMENEKHRQWKEDSLRYPDLSDEAADYVYQDELAAKQAERDWSNFKEQFK